MIPKEFKVLIKGCCILLVVACHTCHIFDIPYLGVFFLNVFLSSFYIVSGIQLGMKKESHLEVDLKELIIRKLYSLASHILPLAFWQFCFISL